MDIKKHNVFSRLLRKSTAKNADALYHRIYRFATKHSIGLEVAMYYLATEYNIGISRYLKDPEIRADMQQINTAQQISTPAHSKKNTQTNKQTIYRSCYLEFSSYPPLLTDSNLKDLRISSEAYQLIYIFENSIRQFINTILTKKYGNDWWNSTHFADEFKKKADDYKKSEDNTPWVKRGNPHPLYYLDFENLAKIIEKAKKIFKPYFSYMGKDMNESWLRIRIHDVNKTRRAVAHSNPITEVMLRDCKSDIERWLKQIPRVIKEL